MLPPHARIHCPLIPLDNGEAKNPINSAISSGIPPCFKVDKRLPPSLMKKGQFSVILVSIKPGATAFANIFLSEAAMACVKPITPDFVKE